MKIRILSLVKKQEEVLKTVEQEFLKRIGRSVPCELREIRRSEIREGSGDASKVLAEEAKKIKGVLKGREVLAVLDKQGKEYNSEEFAAWLKARMAEGSELVFILGGPLGLSEEISAQARWKISLSRLTFPHKLARVILLEAIYRAMEIGRGSRYHK